MSANPTDPNDVKLLPPVGEAGRPPAPNPGGAGGAGGGGSEPATVAAVLAAASPPNNSVAISVSTSASRQLADLPRDELATLAEEFGLEPRRYKTSQELVAAIHGRRQLIASLDRDAMVDVVRWGR